MRQVASLAGGLAEPLCSHAWHLGKACLALCTAALQTAHGMRWQPAKARVSEASNVVQSMLNCRPSKLLIVHYDARQIRLSIAND